LLSGQQMGEPIDDKVPQLRTLIRVATGDRRRRIRFPLDAEVGFQLSELGHDNPTQGTGKVEDISSSGLAFRTNEPPEPGSHLAVSIAWPAKRDDCNLRLIFHGVVLRASGVLVVVTIQCPEFRTAGESTPSVGGGD
jgi:hypothetical protein